MQKNTEQDFWAKVERGEYCWLWTGGTSHKGYGRMSMSGKRKAAHRIAYEFTYGPIPDGLNVCHKCDVTDCVNPEHLFLGTQMDNVQDMRSKGRERKAFGETHTRAKLNVQTVRSIRQDVANGYNQREIAERHGLKLSTAASVASGRAWRRVV